MAKSSSSLVFPHWSKFQGLLSPFFCISYVYLRERVGWSEFGKGQVFNLLISFEFYRLRKYIVVFLEIPIYNYIAKNVKDCVSSDDSLVAAIWGSNFWLWEENWKYLSNAVRSMLSWPRATRVRKRLCLKIDWDQFVDMCEICQYINNQKYHRRWR